MNTISYNTVVELSKDGPTQIGPFLVCGNGLSGGHRRVGSRFEPIPSAERGAVQRDQVEVVKELLRGCRPTRWAREVLSPASSDLKHWAENWGGPDFRARGQAAYVSTGAVIVAAVELGFVCVPAGDGSRNVWIGVHFADVAARMAERGWYIVQGHEGATRIQSPEPPPTRMEPTDETDVTEMVGCEPCEPNDLPLMFWRDLAGALGLSEAEEH